VEQRYQAVLEVINQASMVRIDRIRASGGDAPRGDN
jgi:hypothetical protein